MAVNRGNYNLVSEPWIPVLLHSGKIKRFGIREALLRAADVRQLACSNPMDRAALLRFLLAVLYWCRGNPRDGDHEQCQHGIPEEWLDKLDEHRECFNMLGDGKRFLQYGGCGANKLPANYLIQEVPTGSNINHFKHATDADTGLCTACCATGLLRLTVFATSGGAGKPPGINAKPPLYAIPMGASLAKTLTLSWHQRKNLGAPQWLDPAIGLPRQGAIPLLVGLTWVPRRVWLMDPNAEPAKCISCGTHCKPIKQIVFAPIGSQKTTDDELGRIWRDPHVIYTVVKGKDPQSMHGADALKSTTGASLQQLNVMQGILQDAEQLCPGYPDGVSPEDHMKQIFVVGFATVQNDKYLESLAWNMPAPDSFKNLESALDGVVGLRKAIDNVSRIVKKQAKKAISLNTGITSSRKLEDMQAVLSSVAADADTQLSKGALNATSLSSDSQRRVSAMYTPKLQVVAGSLAPSVTTKDMQLKAAIENAVQMISTKNTIKRTRRTEGSDERD